MTAHPESSHAGPGPDLGPMANHELAIRSRRVALMSAPAAVILVLFTETRTAAPIAGIVFIFAHLLIGIARMIWAERFARHYDGAPTTWRHALTLLVVLTAAAWGLSAVAMLQWFGVSNSFFLNVLMLTGIGATGVSSLSPRPAVFRLFLGILVTPTLIHLCFQESLVALGLAVALVLYMVQMTLLANYLRSEFEKVRTNEHLLQERAVALEEAHERVQATDRARSQFMANMSHEIRTPLNGILGMTDSLRETKLDDDQRDQLGDIQRSGDNLLTIVNEILDFSRLEAGGIVLEARVFDLHQTLEDVVRPLRLTARQRGNTLDVEAASDLPPHVRGDALRLWQVLTNLANNALKFTQNGRVVLRVRKEEDQLSFAVIDTGIGIAPEALGEVFSAYRQADESTTRRYGGTGLGLAIVKRLVEAMDGTVSAQSTPGSGSTFNVVLPMAAATPAEAAPTTVVADEGPCDVHVLLAEDNDVNARLVERMVAKAGGTLERVADGRAAVAAWRAGYYDLILMDVQMPEMDGFEATTAIRNLEQSQDAHIPIIALTAHALAGYREKCVAVGMDEYLTKPIKYDKLRTALRTWNRGAPATSSS